MCIEIFVLTTLLLNTQFPHLSIQGFGQVFSNSPLIWQFPEPPSPWLSPWGPTCVLRAPTEPLASPQRLWNPGRAGGAAPGSGASSPSCRCHDDNAGINLLQAPLSSSASLPLLACLCLLGAPAVGFRAQSQDQAWVQWWGKREKQEEEKAQD